MTATTAAEKKPKKPATEDNDDDENFVDEYANSSRELETFMKAHGGASFKVVWERYLKTMLEEIRDENAEAHARIDDLYDRLPDTDVIAAFVDDTLIGLSKVTMLFDKILVSAGFLVKGEGGENTLTSSFPEELKGEYAEVAMAVAGLMTTGQELRESLADDDGDEDDADGDDETEASA